MHFLITAGPTREYIDPVRFISNGSTGKMGYACAAAALRRGHEVTLVSGPVSLAAPSGLRCIDVVTSDQMARAVHDHFGRCDCVIMTAAVGDYKPRQPKKQKIEKTDRPFTLVLKRTVDILAKLGQTKKHQVLIGFAMQDRAGRRNAQMKMVRKNLDAIVLNSPKAFGADRTEVQILRRDGKWQGLGQVRKTTAATAIIKLAEKLVKDGASVKGGG